MAEGVPIALTPDRRFHERYEVVRCIQTGGMGAVYEVVDVRTRRRRALKVMLASLANDADLRARFELEARVTADVESEHIVETFDAGIDAETGAPFLVMELLRGVDLAALLDQRGRLPPSEVVVLLEQAARALDRTHQAGIVHRDLKPGNLFVAQRDDGTPRLKILDFGIAKLVAQSTQSIKTTMSVGTPIFMSPEQIRGDGTIDRRADVYSLGHIAYAMLVGDAYWETEARASEAVYPLLMKVAQGAMQRPSERAAMRGVALAPGFDAWFARATAMDPRERFATAGELVRELARVLDGAPQLAASSTLVLAQPQQPASGRTSPATDLTNTVGDGREVARGGRGLLIAGGALVVAVGIAIAVAAGRRTPASEGRVDPPRDVPVSQTAAPSALPAATTSEPAVAPAPPASSSSRPLEAKPPPFAPLRPGKPRTSAPQTATSPAPPPPKPAAPSDPTDTR